MNLTASFLLFSSCITVFFLARWLDRDRSLFCFLYAIVVFTHTAVMPLLYCSLNAAQPHVRRRPTSRASFPFTPPTYTHTFFAIGYPLCSFSLPQILSHHYARNPLRPSYFRAILCSIRGCRMHYMRHWRKTFSSYGLKRRQVFSMQRRCSVVYLPFCRT